MSWLWCPFLLVYKETQARGTSSSPGSAASSPAGVWVVTLHDARVWAATNSCLPLNKTWTTFPAPGHSRTMVSASQGYSKFPKFPCLEKKGKIVCAFYTCWLSEVKRQTVSLLAVSNRWFLKYRGDDRGAESMKTRLVSRAAVLCYHIIQCYKVQQNDNLSPAPRDDTVTLGGKYTRSKLLHNITTLIANNSTLRWTTNKLIRWILITNLFQHSLVRSVTEENKKDKTHVLTQEQVNNWDKVKYNNNNCSYYYREVPKRERAIKPRRNKWCTVQLLTTHWTMPRSFPTAPVIPVFMLTMTVYGTEYPPSQFGPPVLATLLPSFLCTSSLVGIWKVLGLGGVSTAQQQLEHQYVTSIILF